jgi:hypothetical protein
MEELLRSDVTGESIPDANDGKNREFDGPEGI